MIQRRSPYGPVRLYSSWIASSRRCTMRPRRPAIISILKRRFRKGVSSQNDHIKMPVRCHAAAAASCPRQCVIGTRYTVGTVAQIFPAKNTRLSGLYTSGGMFCTQCEAEGFRRITFAQDRPDVMSTFSASPFDVHIYSFNWIRRGRGRARELSGR